MCWMYKLYWLLSVNKGIWLFFYSFFWIFYLICKLFGIKINYEIYYFFYENNKLNRIDYFLLERNEKKYVLFLG